MSNCRIEVKTRLSFSYLWKMRIGDFPSPGDKDGYYTLLGELINIVNASGQSTNGTGSLDFLEPHQPLYPKEKDKEFFESYEEQEKDWFNLAVSTQDQQKFTGRPGAVFLPNR